MAERELKSPARRLVDSRQIERNQNLAEEGSKVGKEEQDAVGWIAHITTCKPGRLLYFVVHGNRQVTFTRDKPIRRIA